VGKLPQTIAALPELGWMAASAEATSSEGSDTSSGTPNACAPAGRSAARTVPSWVQTTSVSPSASVTTSCTHPGASSTGLPKRAPAGALATTTGSWPGRAGENATVVVPFSATAVHSLPVGSCRKSPRSSRWARPKRLVPGALTAANASKGEKTSSIPSTPAQATTARPSGATAALRSTLEGEGPRRCPGANDSPGLPKRVCTTLE
jgi:hypothetical protein